jgi:hypothetical protein
MSCEQGRLPCDCGHYGSQYYCFESCKEKCREKKWCGMEPPEKNSVEENPKNRNPVRSPRK